MTIQLKPETEALIQQDIRAEGPYHSAQEFVEHAVLLLHDHEVWLSSNKAAIATQLEEGYAAACKGELADEDQVRARMDSKKIDWSSGQVR